ncbi:hypothetical protein HDU80_000805 [Chytriomyces hyalinus]|nr:hypothetical protein HDU80_000805 [Chytriomyces hyalinus]
MNGSLESLETRLAAQDAYGTPTETEMYALHGSGLVVIFLSIVGSAFMVCDSIRIGKHKTLSGRFPIYLGGLNFCWSVSHSIDHTWMMVLHGLNPPLDACRSLGGILSIFLFAEIFLIDAMALFMLATVHFKRQFTLGDYDWILIVLVIGTPILYTVIAGAIGALGPDKNWCFLNISVPEGRILLAITVAAALACVGLPAICFFLIYRILNAHSKETKGLINSGDFTGAVIKKLLMFQMSVTVSFMGIVLHGIAVMAFEYSPMPLVFVTVLTVNSGGWINAMIYILQEYFGVGTPASSSSRNPSSANTGKGSEAGSTFTGSVSQRKPSSSPDPASIRRKSSAVGAGSEQPPPALPKASAPLSPTLQRKGSGMAPIRK